MFHVSKHTHTVVFAVPAATHMKRSFLFTRNRSSRALMTAVLQHFLETTHLACAVGGQVSK